MRAEDLVIGRKYEVSVGGLATARTRIRTYRGMGYTRANGGTEPQHLFGDENNKGSYSVGTTDRALSRILREVETDAERPAVPTQTNQPPTNLEPAVTTAEQPSTDVSRIENVLNQRMRVLSAMVPGKTYSTGAVAKAAVLPTTRTRHALNALAKVGMVLKVYGHERMAGIPYYGDERDELPRWVRMV